VPIKSFSEKTIRNRILNKVQPKVHKGRKHDKGYIYLDGMLVTKIKIPNEHPKIMHESKSKYLAADLRLNDSDFNSLIDCTLTGSDYYKLLKDLQLNLDTN